MSDDTAAEEQFIDFKCPACGEDVSLESPDAPLPEAVASGKEPFLIIGAIAGG